MDLVAETTKTKPRADTDGAWKFVIENDFKGFMAFYWPAIFEQIDWDRAPPEFLEQEKLPIIKKQAQGKRIMDKLVKVYLKHTKAPCLFHIEVEQGGPERDIFPHRMYVYDYRIYDTYQGHIVNLAMLIDGDPKWRPHFFERSLFGANRRFEYPILKILDFRKRQKELQESSDPYALITLTQLAAIDTRRNQKARLSAKFALTKKLYNSKSDVSVLSRFIDEVLALDEDHALQYEQLIKRLEKELNMGFITLSEKRWQQEGIQKGRQEGKQEGESTALVILLRKKFHQIPNSYLQKIQAAKPEVLLVWIEHLLEAKTLDDVFVED